MNGVKKSLTIAMCVLSLFVFSPFKAEAGAYNKVTAEVQIYCSHVKELDLSSYEITIEPENRAPVPQPDTLILSDNETGSFYIEIDEPGTYLYKVYECPGADENIDYDETVYHLTVYVEDKTEDGLVYAVTVTSDDSDYKPETIYFQNSFSGDEYITTTTTVVTTTSNTTQSSSTTSRTETHTTQAVTTTTASNGKTSTWFRDFFAPLTGDNTPIGRLAVLTAAAGVLLLLARKRKQEEEGDEK